MKTFAQKLKRNKNMAITYAFLLALEIVFDILYSPQLMILVGIFISASVLLLTLLEYKVVRRIHYVHLIMLSLDALAAVLPNNTIRESICLVMFSIIAFLKLIATSLSIHKSNLEGAKVNKNSIGKKKPKSIVPESRITSFKQNIPLMLAYMFLYCQIASCSTYMAHSLTVSPYLILMPLVLLDYKTPRIINYCWSFVCILLFVTELIIRSRPTETYPIYVLLLVVHVIIVLWTALWFRYIRHKETGNNEELQAIR